MIGTYDENHLPIKNIIYIQHDYIRSPRCGVQEGINIKIISAKDVYLKKEFTGESFEGLIIYLDSITT